MPVGSNHSMLSEAQPTDGPASPVSKQVEPTAYSVPCRKQGFCAFNACLGPSPGARADSAVPDTAELESVKARCLRTATCLVLSVEVCEAPPACPHHRHHHNHPRYDSQHEIIVLLALLQGAAVCYETDEASTNLHNDQTITRIPASVPNAQTLRSPENKLQSLTSTPEPLASQM